MSIRGALLDTQEQISRARLLPAAVEILLAADDLAAARAASAELSEIALAFGAPLLAAASAHAAGAVRLADGDIEAASHRCGRRARPGASWRCRTKRRIPACCWPPSVNSEAIRTAAVSSSKPRDDGSSSSTPHRGSRASPSNRSAASHQRIGSLSERETQVLRLLAAGKTNRAIADELFISEKTVARHVSNIFDKLGVSSRTGATAWAFQHNLI